MTPKPYFKSYLPLFTSSNASNAVDLASPHWGKPHMSRSMPSPASFPCSRMAFSPISTCWYHLSALSCHALHKAFWAYPSDSFWFRLLLTARCQVPLWAPWRQKHVPCSLRQHIHWNGNDTEKMSVAPAQGWHASSWSGDMSHWASSHQPLWGLHMYITN